MGECLPVERLRAVRFYLISLYECVLSRSGTLFNKADDDEIFTRLLFIIVTRAESARLDVV
jgi:hypothetical protein